MFNFEARLPCFKGSRAFDLLVTITAQRTPCSALLLQLSRSSHLRFAHALSAVLSRFTSSFVRDIPILHTADLQYWSESVRESTMSSADSEAQEKAHL